MLLNGAPPAFKVCVLDVWSNVTVFEPVAKVPPDLLQLPSTVKLPLGAVSVPELSETLPFTSTAPLPPVNVPPATEKLPLTVIALFPAAKVPSATLKLL